MHIEKIVIMTNISSTDQITLYTNMPTTFPKIPDQGNMLMDIDLEHGTAIEYAKKNFSGAEFPATAEVIDGKDGRKTIIDLFEC